MGQLVFQAALGGAVNLIGPNISATTNFTLPGADGTNGQALTTNGSGVLGFSSIVSGAAGSNTQVQFNSGGNFGASASLTWDGTNLTSTGFSGPHNGTVGATTPNTGSFTTLAASSTVSGTGFSTYLASPPAIGSTAANTGAFTTLTTSSTVTLNGGTANGVTYLNGSKVLTSGSALTFDGANLGVGTTSATRKLTVSNSGAEGLEIGPGNANGDTSGAVTSIYYNRSGSAYVNAIQSANSFIYQLSGTEQMRLTSTGLGIGTSSPLFKLQSNGTVARKYVTAGTSGSPAEEAGFIYADDTSTPVAGMWFYNAFSSNSATQLSFKTRTSGGTVTEAVRIDASQNVGIGTSSPNSAGFGKGVEVYSAAASAASIVTGGSNSYSWVVSSDTNAFRAFKGTTELMRLDASGNLIVGGTSASAASATTLYNDGTIVSILGSGVGGTSIFGAISGVSNGYEISVTSGNAQTYKWFNGGTQAMTLDASGNLLVGTTSQIGGSNVSLYQPSNADMKVGVGVSTGTRAAYQVFVSNTVTTVGTENSTGGSLVSGSSAYSTVIANSGAYPLSFGTNNTERARITSAGKFLVGQTAISLNNNNSAEFKGGCGLGAISTGGSAFSSIQTWNQATSGDNVFIEFLSDAGASLRGSITYNRTAGLTAYNTTSDYRAKDISGPVTDSGVLIDSVPVYMGKMKGATQERPMFIAHETPAYAHTGEKDAVDADGNPVYQQMDASALIPVMWAEIQSLRQRLAAANL